MWNVAAKSDLLILRSSKSDGFLQPSNPFIKFKMNPNPKIPCCVTHALFIRFDNFVADVLSP